MDLIITVCDNAAGKVCPIWPGHPVTAHWGFEDPAAFVGPDEQKREHFERVYQQILKPVQLLAALPDESLSDAALRSQGKKNDNS